MSKKKKTESRRHSSKREQTKTRAQESSPDWTQSCTVCGQSPVHPVTGMCGPCSFGEAGTAGGEW